MLKLLSNILIFPLVVLIKVYQLFISPIFPSRCRYQPTCSHYAVEALKEWGIFKGTYLAARRILSCHPWGGFGYDPVPKKTDKEERPY